MKLVASLARPGGSLTGQLAMLGDMMAKRMQLPKEAIPKASCVALLVDPQAPWDRKRAIAHAQAAARLLRLTVEIFDAGTPMEIEQAFAAMAQRRPDAVMVTQTSLFFEEKDRIGRLTLAHRLPSVSPGRQFAGAGALVSHAPVWAAVHVFDPTPHTCATTLQ